MNEFNLKLVPINYWLSQNNDLTEISCSILNIPCSEAEVEQLFGCLSFMVYPTSNLMKDDLINAEMIIRMDKNFYYLNEFNMNSNIQLLQKILQSQEKDIW